MKGLRYVTMPRNSWSSVMLVGVSRACTASTFSGSWWTLDSWYDRGIQRISPLRPWLVFSWGWTLNHIFGQLPWASIGRHHVHLPYVHGWWYHQQSQFNLLISPIFDPSSSGKHPGSRQGQREDVRSNIAIWGVRGGEQTGFGVKDNYPISMSGIQLCEVLRVSKLMSYFFHCVCAVMVPANGIIEIMKIQTDT